MMCLFNHIAYFLSLFEGFTVNKMLNIAGVGIKYDFIVIHLIHKKFKRI